MEELRSTVPDSDAVEDVARPPALAVSQQSLAANYASAVDLRWGTGSSDRQALMGWGLLGTCVLGIIWGSLPGGSWLPRHGEPWEYAVWLGVALVTRLLAGFIIYEYEGFQVAAALVANRKITPDLAEHTRANIQTIQRQGALESMFGGRQLILVSTVLFPTVVEAAFHPLLPSFQAADGTYLSSLLKVTVKTFSFAVLICILAQVPSQMKAIAGPVAWMSRRTTRYVITSVGFAESLGLIVPSRSVARVLHDHHDLDGQPGTVHEWATWWTERVAVRADGGSTPPPYLLAPDHPSHIMPHRVLVFLLSQHDDPFFYEETVPSFMYASICGLDGGRARGYWTWLDQNVAAGRPRGVPTNHPFIWRTGADTLGHIPPHHMVMVLVSSYLLILKSSASPDRDVERLFTRFAEAAFGDPDTFADYWSSVRKYRIGSDAPLAQV